MEKILPSRSRDMTDTYTERCRTSHAARSNSKPELAAIAYRNSGWWVGGYGCEDANFLKTNEASRDCLGQQPGHYLFKVRTCRLAWIEETDGEEADASHYAILCHTARD